MQVKSRLCESSFFRKFYKKNLFSSFTLFLITLSGSLIAAPTDRAYVIFDDENEIGVINTLTRTLITTIDISDEPNNSLIISQDGERLYISSDDDDIINIIDTNTNKIIGNIEDIRAGSLALTPDGTRLYCINKDDETVEVFDTVTFENITTIDNANFEDLRSIVVDPVTGRKAYVSDGTTDRIFEIDTATNTVSGQINEGVSTSTLLFSGDGSRLYACVSAAQDQVRIYDTTTNQRIGILNNTNNCVFLALNPEETKIYIGNYDATVYVFNLENNVNTQIAGSPFTVGQSSEGLAVSPDGAEVWVSLDNGDNENMISIHRASDFQKIGEISNGIEDPNGIVFAPLPPPPQTRGIILDYRLYVPNRMTKGLRIK